MDYCALEDAEKALRGVRRLSNILRRKYEALEKYLSDLRRELDLKLVILFGSLARGGWKENSDIDLLIVSDNLSDDPNFMRLKRDAWSHTDIARFLEELQRPNLLLLDVLEYDKRIIGDEAFMRSVKRNSRKLKKEIWVEVY